MSMPEIIGSDTTREQSVTDIIESVSLQQAALSHILNAEGKKLQAVINMQGATMDEILGVNDSVKNMVSSITKLEHMLISKLELFGDKLLPPPPIRFTFGKNDINTLAGLTGAVFELYNSDGVLVETATSLRGKVTFKKQYAGTYTMREVTPPDGYQPSMYSIYTVVITDKDNITINGTPAKDFVVSNTPYPNMTARKTDDLGAPLANGKFQLVSSGRTYTATSDASGNALFERVVPGDYVLTETAAPSGYKKSADSHDVKVTAAGVLTIDGLTKNTVTYKNQIYMDIAVNVIFNDTHNASGRRPDNVTVNLYRNGTLFENYTVNTGKPDFDSTYVYIHLLEKYDDTGTQYLYTVDQTAIPYYNTIVDDYTIINNIIPV